MQFTTPEPDTVRHGGTHDPAGRGTRRRPAPRASIMLAIVSVVVLVLGFVPSAGAKSGPATVRVKSYYLALGTSLAYGQQPPDFDHGYPQQWFGMLQSDGSRSLTNYGCPGMTSDGMINQINCTWVDPYIPSHPTLPSHDPYNGKTQLGAAVAFIKAHQHQVSPVSLDMGSNDLLPDIHIVFSPAQGRLVCQYDLGVVRAHTMHLDANLTDTILPQLVEALNNPGGRPTGDLVMMNFYDPFQNLCPETVPVIQEINQHLADDAATVGARYGVTIRMADVFTAFGGAATPNPNIEKYTWFRPSAGLFDPHATTEGYGVIAQTFNSFVGD